MFINVPPETDEQKEKTYQDMMHKFEQYTGDGTTTQKQATILPVPCPTCQTCPTCGRRNVPQFPYYPYVTWAYNPQAQPVVMT